MLRTAFRSRCSKQKEITICKRRDIYLLSPISRIADAGGPMNLSPSASQSCAKSALSERKPYPGWIACTNHMETDTSEISYLQGSSQVYDTLKLSLASMIVFLCLHANVILASNTIQKVAKGQVKWQEYSVSHADLCHIQYSGLVECCGGGS